MSHTVADALASVSAVPRGHAFQCSRAQLGCNAPHDHGKAVRYERLPAGAVVALAMPGRPDAVAERVPSDYLLRTRALDAPRRPVVHCPSFLNSGRCVRGADCEYAHLVPPTGAGTRYDAAALIASAKAQHAAARASASPASLMATTTPMPWYARAAAASSTPPGPLPSSLTTAPAQRASASHCMPRHDHHQPTSTSPLQDIRGYYDACPPSAVDLGGARHYAPSGCTPSALAAIGGESARAAAASAAAAALLSSGRRGGAGVRRRSGATRRGGGTSDSRRHREGRGATTTNGPDCGAILCVDRDASAAAAMGAEPSSLTSSTTEGSSATASRRLSGSWRHNPYAASSAPPSPSGALTGNALAE